MGEAISTRTSAWSYGRVPLTLTFQKEVAERMVAIESSPRRCRLSFMCQNWCHVYHKFNISGASFVPKPDVDVGVIHMIPRKVPLTCQPFDLVEKVTRQSFVYRRKSIIHCLRTLFPPGEARRQALAEELCSLANINPAILPFHFDNDDFARLCEAYDQICLKYPGIKRFTYGGKK